MKLTPISRDSLDEVQVHTANYSARYGTAGGAVINAVTRNGASAFHGSAYEYFRNDKLEARKFLALAPPPLKQNQYGLTIAGPVLLPRYRQGRVTKPSSWARTGASCGAPSLRSRHILDPSNNNRPFSGNQIPASRINANAALMMKTYLPAPNYEKTQASFN